MATNARARVDRQAEVSHSPSRHPREVALNGVGNRSPLAVAERAWPEVVCPFDRGRLEVYQGTMVCEFGHRWGTDRGIPRMVPGGKTYADAFGLQWRTYRTTQLDSRSRTTLSRDRARRCLGEECWKLLHSTRRVDVLEVGCGAGRFTEVLLSTGAYVTSIDLSDAVDANQENFPHHARHRILQADVGDLPFRPRQYDVVFCLGVVQHTPSPERTIEKLYEQVKSGGSLVIDHYTYSLSEFTKAAPLVRMVLCRVSPGTGLRWSNRLVNWFLPLHRAVRHHPFAQAVLSRVSPVLSYYHALPIDEGLQREWALLDTHDALTDRFKHFRTRRQISTCLTTLGAETIWCEHGGNGVEARCRRPNAFGRDPGDQQTAEVE
jgi:2-polyprenyl-3-methyl-5-hydroxy-6-metoxy-1,4-benzoquinol methylase